MDKIGGIMLEQLQGVQQSQQVQDPEKFAAIMAELITAILEPEPQGTQAQEVVEAAPEEEQDESKEILIPDIFYKADMPTQPLVTNTAQYGNKKAEEPVEQIKTTEKILTSGAEVIKKTDPGDQSAEKAKTTPGQTKNEETVNVKVFDELNLSPRENGRAAIDTKLLEPAGNKLESQLVKTKSEPEKAILAEDNKTPMIQTETPRTTGSTVTDKPLIVKPETISFETNIEKLEETILRSITTIREGQSTIMKVKLEPENLGKVDLDLTMENGRLNAKINVETNQVRELFNENLSQLHQGLLKHNIQIGKIILEVNTGNEAGQWDFSNQGGFRQSYKRSTGGDNIKTSLKSINEITAVQATQQTGLNILA